MIILTCIDTEKVGGAVAKMLDCEVRDHGFDAHQRTTGKWNSKPHWLNLVNEGDG